MGEHLFSHFLSPVGGKVPRLGGVTLLGGAEAVFAPQTIVLVAATGIDVGEALMVTLFSLDVANQLGFVEFARFDPFVARNGTDVVQFHSGSPLYMFDASYDRQ